MFDRGRGFSSKLCVQTGPPGAHPASHSVSTWDPFPRDKVQPGYDADRSPPHLVPRLRMNSSCTSSPLCTCTVCNGVALLSIINTSALYLHAVSGFWLLDCFVLWHFEELSERNQVQIISIDTISCSYESSTRYATKEERSILV